MPPLNFIEVPLGEAELPSTEPVRMTTPCGERMQWDEASWHVLECDACDKTQKKNHFIEPGDYVARRTMGLI